MEREKLEAWADALLAQHRTTPATSRSAARPSEHERMARLMADVGVTPAPDLMTYRRAQTDFDPDAWVAKARAMALVLGAVLLMGLVLALAAS